MAVAHRSGDQIIVELELASDPLRGFLLGEPARHRDRGGARLREADDLDTTARAAAGEIRRLTGFDRVLVYRFDPDWKRRRDRRGQGSGLGPLAPRPALPASDIPAQARALYTRSKSRFVVDRDYVPVPLVAAPGTSNGPVDLTFAQARSLSPVHLEYQRNLGVNGSMSISILVEGRLWGLMIATTASRTTSRRRPGRP